MAENKCNLCGTELNEEGKCPNNHTFKKMCLNCAFLKRENDALLCGNDENACGMLDKIRDAANKVCNGYEITGIDIKPLPLKKPELKCGKWELSEEVKNQVLTLFV